MDLMLVVIAALQAYVLGSINFAVIFSKLFGKKDVRQFGSGNAGMTNVVRTFGVLPGFLTFLFDVLKAFVATYIGKCIIFTYLAENYSGSFYVPVYGALLCGIFVMLGHVFPVFFQFKGGKAVAVSVGIFLIADWRAILIVLGVFLLTLLTTRIISVSSLLATIVMPFCIAFLPGERGGKMWVQIALVMVMVIIIYIKHLENIKRLIKGEEKPIFGKKE